MRIYLDSCILIYLVASNAAASVAVAEAMAAAGGAELCISDLVRLECRVGPLKDHDDKRVHAFDRAFGDCTLLTLDGAVYDKAAELRAEHRLRTPDALHLAAAIRHGCQEFWTADQRLARADLAVAVRVIGPT